MYCLSAVTGVGHLARQPGLADAEPEEAGDEGPAQEEAGPVEVGLAAEDGGADEVGVADQAAGGLGQGGGEELPGQQAGEDQDSVGAVPALGIWARVPKTRVKTTRVRKGRNRAQARPMRVCL